MPSRAWLFPGVTTAADDAVHETFLTTHLLSCDRCSCFFTEEAGHGKEECETALVKLVMES